MDSASERRARLRIVVGPEVTIQFQVKQLAYRNLRITNLSGGGCFATIPRTDNHLFQQGTLLEQFRFENPDLAGDPILGKVTYVLGGAGGGRGGLEIIGLGIRFVSMTTAMESLLRGYIEARL